MIGIEGAAGETRPIAADLAANEAAVVDSGVNPGLAVLIDEARTARACDDEIRAEEAKIGPARDTRARVLADLHDGLISFGTEALVKAKAQIPPDLWGYFGFPASDEEAGLLA